MHTFPRWLLMIVLLVATGSVWGTDGQRRYSSYGLDAQIPALKGRINAELARSSSVSVVLNYAHLTTDSTYPENQIDAHVVFTTPTSRVSFSTQFHGHVDSAVIHDDTPRRGVALVEVTQSSNPGLATDGFDAQTVSYFWCDETGVTDLIDLGTKGSSGYNVWMGTIKLFDRGGVLYLLYQYAENPDEVSAQNQLVLIDLARYRQSSEGIISIPTTPVSDYQQSLKYHVGTARAPLRSTPDAEAAPVAQLTPDQSLEVVEMAPDPATLDGRPGYWLKAVTDAGQTGWVWSNDLWVEGPLQPKDVRTALDDLSVHDLPALAKLFNSKAFRDPRTVAENLRTFYYHWFTHADLADVKALVASQPWFYDPVTQSFSILNEGYRATIVSGTRGWPTLSRLRQLQKTGGVESPWFYERRTKTFLTYQAAAKGPPTLWYDDPTPRVPRLMDDPDNANVFRYFLAHGRDDPQVARYLFGLTGEPPYRGDDPSFNHLLFQRVDLGNVGIALFLVDAGLDINRALPAGKTNEGTYSSTLLEVACYSGDPSAVEALVEKGADPNQVRMEQGRPTSPLASLGGFESNQADLARYLVKKGARASDPRSRMKVLLSNDGPTIALGVQDWSDLNQVDDQGYALLHRLARAGANVAIEQVLAHGASPYLRTATEKLTPYALLLAQNWSLGYVPLEQVAQAMARLQPPSGTDAGTVILTSAQLYAEPRLDARQLKLSGPGKPATVLEGSPLMASEVIHAPAPWGTYDGQQVKSFWVKVRVGNQVGWVPGYRLVTS